MKWFKYFILRLLYRFCYGLCDCFAPKEVLAEKDFYARFRRPSELKDHEIGWELERLIAETSDY